jgi:hypothetical protein
MFLKGLTLNLSLRIPLPSPIIAGFGVAGFILGIVSIVKNRDRSFFTILSVVIGLLITVWICAEIMFPH